MVLTASVVNCLKIVPCFCEIFSHSLSSFPRLWKESTVVSLAKVPSPKVLNDCLISWEWFAAHHEEEFIGHGAEHN